MDTYVQWQFWNPRDPETLPNAARDKAIRQARADGWTYREIGTEFHLSAARVSQIVHKAERVARYLALQEKVMGRMTPEEYDRYRSRYRAPCGCLYQEFRSSSHPDYGDLEAWPIPKLMEPCEDHATAAAVLNARAAERKSRARVELTFRTYETAKRMHDKHRVDLLQATIARKAYEEKRDADAGTAAEPQATATP